MEILSVEWTFKITLLVYLTLLLSFILVEEVEAAERAARTATKGKKAPRCSICRNPMKGHKRVLDCPKNQNTTNM